MSETWVEGTQSDLQKAEASFVLAKQVNAFALAGVLSSVSTLVFLVAHFPAGEELYFSLAIVCSFICGAILPFSIIAKRRAWNRRNAFRKRFFMAGYRVESDGTVVTNELYPEIIFQKPAGESSGGKRPVKKNKAA